MVNISTNLAKLTPSKITCYTVNWEDYFPWKIKLSEFLKFIASAIFCAVKR